MNIKLIKNRVLRFMIGDRPFLVTADEILMMAGLSHWDTEGEWIEYDNNTLDIKYVI